ncbi:hypothetical protein LB557_04595 [Mesorhizobium sp. BR115XR7A]|uniref:hypothetical protein n=1 Tax=Mesorhizobium sp. BR115XR7A TaxID=2876645 RepID=UPI001CD0A298|nr:hypothetical protein [Mesorhizobium sp. BR115XR7A]MBZ9905290.1 hypothetical protein [Mesorhizobium sp. BR115XR7A]MBZ9930362.1 hypothetical protein [Mesorhizobium sp. BR1-1-5]
MPVHVEVRLGVAFAGALFDVESKAQMLEHRGAWHLALQFFSCCFSILLRTRFALPSLQFRAGFSVQELDAAKSKAGKGAAGKPAFVPGGANRRPRRSFPCRAPRPNGKDQPSSAPR